MKKILAAVLSLNMLFLSACANGNVSDTAITEKTVMTTAETDAQQEEEWLGRPVKYIDDKYRTFYEIFVYSFYDNNGDGVGDINGVREKLDYLNDGDDSTADDLGINGIWLMPVMPSTTYHKYDVTNYMSIDPEYGTIGDFKSLLDDCHYEYLRRGYTGNVT